MESTYLYYPKRKIFNVLLSELPKRGYEVMDHNELAHSIRVRKKLFSFFGRVSLTIEMEDIETTITKIFCIEKRGTEDSSKYTPELLQVILRIF